MANKKIQYRIRKGGSNGGERRKLTAAQKGKYLLIVALLVAGGFGLYQYFAPDKYEYWNQLIAKDPKPQGVSEAEYREKLRAGYCWRDRKFYQPEELHQKAMVGFAGRLLGEVYAYRTDQTTNQGGGAYTSGGCKRNQKACSVWFVPQGYTNEQWDKLFLAEKDPYDGTLLAKYPEKEIRQPMDLQNYLVQHHNKDFTLVFRSYGGGFDVYGSDCCKVLSKKAVEPKIKNNTLITYLQDGAIFPENDIPQNINIEDYGVGNFYLEFKRVVPGFFQDEKGKKTFQPYSSKILLMNNCGDVLWQPYYFNLHQNEKD